MTSLGHRPSLAITLLLGDQPAGSGWLQPLADGELWTEQPLRAGARRADRPQLARLETPIADRSRSAFHWTTIYDGPGLVDGAVRRLRAALSESGERRVDFEDGESFLLAADGDLIHRWGAGPPNAHSLERALGAPLALALALRGIHLLHASAVVRTTAPAGDSTGVIAFTAASGSGKSTLAAAGRSREMSEGSKRSTFARIADDILPVRLEPPTLALPHFPQLKLPASAAWPQDAAAALPLARLVEIEHSPDQRGIEIERLSPAAACLALARATVAARLFDADLLRRHFDLCAAAGAVLPVQRLRYPSGLDRLPEVLAAIAGSEP